MRPQQAIIYESNLLALIGIFRLFLPLHALLLSYCPFLVCCTKKESAHVLIILYTLLLLYTTTACFSIKLRGAQV